MWANLKNWQKSIIILAISTIVFYILGMFLWRVNYDPFLNVYDPFLNMVPFLNLAALVSLGYSISFVLPILIIKYTRRKYLKIIAGIILGIFVLISAFNIIVTFRFYAPSLQGNPLITIFSILYAAPVNGGFIIGVSLLGGM
jgi:hypothetical protein